MAESLFLYGAGGHAKVIIDLLKSQNIKLSGMFDDNPRITDFLGYPVIHNSINTPLIISIGNNTIRKKIATKFHNVQYNKLVAHSAIISESSNIAEGSVVMHGAIIQSSSNIGRHVIVNTAATIDHDCVINDYAHIAPGCHLCGNVEVGEGTLIGAGSVIIPGVKIGKWCVIGAGSVVINDIPDNVMAVGNPCKIYKTTKNNE